MKKGSWNHKDSRADREPLKRLAIIVELVGWLIGYEVGAAHVLNDIVSIGN